MWVTGGYTPSTHAKATFCRCRFEGKYCDTEYFYRHREAYFSLTVTQTRPQVLRLDGSYVSQHEVKHKKVKPEQMQKRDNMRQISELLTSRLLSFELVKWLASVTALLPMFPRSDTSSTTINHYPNLNVDKRVGLSD